MGQPLPFYAYQQVSQQPSLGVSNIFGMSHLDGLLTISSKTIQARDRTGALV